MDPSVPADPSTILPPPTLAQMTASPTPIGTPGVESSGRRGRRRLPNRLQTVPNTTVPSLAPQIPVFSQTILASQLDSMPILTADQKAQQDTCQWQDLALTSINQGSIQHNICPDDSKEQIDTVSDADDVIPASFAMSEAPQSSDPQLGASLQNWRNQQIAFESAKASSASNDRISQDLQAEVEADELYTSDPLHTQEIKMELMIPNTDVASLNTQRISPVGSSELYASINVEQQESFGPCVAQSILPSTSLNVTDIKNLSDIYTSVDRLSHQCDSEDIASANRSLNDAQFLVSTSALDTDQDQRNLSSPPSHTLVPKTSVARHNSQDNNFHKRRPITSVYNLVTLKEQSETDNASEITNPYVKGSTLSSHELVTAALTKRNTPEIPDYWAENSAFQLDCDSPLKTSSQGNLKEAHCTRDPSEPNRDSISGTLQPGTLTIGTDISREPFPAVSELSEGEKTISTMYQETSQSVKPQNPGQTLEEQVSTQSNQNSSLVEVSLNPKDMHSVILLSERRAKSCKRLDVSETKIVKDNIIRRSPQLALENQGGIMEASNMDDKIESMSEPISLIDVPPQALTDVVKIDLCKNTNAPSINEQRLSRPVSYTNKTPDNPSLFPLLPSVSSIKILKYLDLLLSEEITASSITQHRIPSYKQLILQAIRFRLLVACPELRSCLFDVDDNRNNLSNLCRDLLFNLPETNCSAPPASHVNFSKQLGIVRQTMLSSNVEDAAHKCLENGIYDHALYLAITSGDQATLDTTLLAFEEYVYSNINPTLSLVYAAHNRRSSQHLRSVTDRIPIQFSTPSICRGQASTSPMDSIPQVQERPSMLTDVEQAELYVNKNAFSVTKCSLVSTLRASGLNSSIRKQYALFTEADVLRKIAFTYMYSLTKEERNDILVSLLVYSKEASENTHIHALLCILLGIPPIYDKYGRFCFSNLCSTSVNQLSAEGQHSQICTGGESSIDQRHLKANAGSELDFFLHKLTAKGIQSVDLFTFRIHEILEYIHFRSSNIPYELFYQATKPVLLGSYGFHQSYCYDITFPFFPHLLPYKLAFAGFLRKESRKNDILARCGLLYSTVAYNSIEQIISQIHLADGGTADKGLAGHKYNPLLMRPSYLSLDADSASSKTVSATMPTYPLEFSYLAMVAPTACGELFITAMHLANNYKKELRTKSSISSVYVKELMLVSPETVASLHNLQKEAYNWTESLLNETDLPQNYRSLLQQTQVLITDIDVYCAYTPNFSSRHIPSRTLINEMENVSSSTEQRRNSTTNSFGKTQTHEHDYSDIKASLTIRSNEPSIIEKGKTAADYILTIEPEFLLQDFIKYQGTKVSFQRHTMLHEDVINVSHSANQTSNSSENSSLDFGVHSEFDDESTINDDADHVDSMPLRMDTTSLIPNPSQTQVVEQSASQIGHSSSTPIPVPLCSKGVAPLTTALITTEPKSKEDTDCHTETGDKNPSTQLQMLTNSIIENPPLNQPSFTASPDTETIAPIDCPPAFTSLVKTYSAATAISRIVPPGFKGSNIDIVVSDHNTSSSDYSTSSDHDIIPSGRLPSSTIHVDIPSKATTHPVLIPVVPPSAAVMIPTDFSQSTNATVSCNGKDYDLINPEIINPVKVNPELTLPPPPINIENVDIKRSPNTNFREPISAIKYTDKTNLDEEKSQEKKNPAQPLLFGFVKAPKSKQETDVAVVDLKANSTGKMAYSQTYGCWVTLDDKGNEIPPPVQEAPEPPPAIMGKFDTHLQYQIEISKRSSANRSTNKTAASRYKLVRG